MKKTKKSLEKELKEIVKKIKVKEEKKIEAKKEDKKEEIKLEENISRPQFSEELIPTGNFIAPVLDSNIKEIESLEQVAAEAPLTQTPNTNDHSNFGYTQRDDSFKYTPNSGYEVNASNNYQREESRPTSFGEERSLNIFNPFSQIRSNDSGMSRRQNEEFQRRQEQVKREAEERSQLPFQEKPKNKRTEIF
jgi:hypothetical protein